MNISLTATQDVQKQIERDILKKIRSVFKYNGSDSLFVEVGILTDSNEVIFHKPLRDRMTHLALYYSDFYIKKEDGRYDRVLPIKTRKEITTTVDGLRYSIGYIDHNDSIIFYDQYL